MSQLQRRSTAALERLPGPSSRGRGGAQPAKCSQGVNRRLTSLLFDCRPGWASGRTPGLNSLRAVLGCPGMLSQYSVWDNLSLPYSYFVYPAASLLVHFFLPFVLMSSRRQWTASYSDCTRIWATGAQWGGRGELQVTLPVGISMPSES